MCHLKPRSLVFAPLWLSLLAVCTPVWSAGKITATTGIIVKDAFETMLSGFPAPPQHFAVAGSCRQSAVPIDWKAREHARWDKPPYDQWLALWAAYHFGARAAYGRSGEHCFDGEFAAMAWQAAIGETVDGQLTGPQGARFVELMDSQHPSFRAQRAGDDRRGKRLANSELQKISNEAARERMESTFTTLWARLVAAPETVTVFPRDLAGDASNPTLGVLDDATREARSLAKAWLMANNFSRSSREALLQQRIRIDAESISLGDTREQLARLLPPALCGEDNQSEHRVCRGTGLETSCEQIGSAMPTVSPLISFMPSLAKKSREVIGLIDGLVATCKMEIEQIARGGTNVRINGIPAVLGLTFDRGRLSTLTVLPSENPHLVERWFSARFGEPSLDRETRTYGGVPYAAMCSELFGCTIHTTPQGETRTETRVWRKGPVRVVRVNQGQFIVELLDDSRPIKLETYSPR